MTSVQDKDIGVAAFDISVSFFFPRYAKKIYYCICLIYSYLGFNSVHSFPHTRPKLTLFKSKTCLQENLKRHCISKHPEGSICHKAMVELGMKTQSEDNKQNHSHLS